MTFNHKQIRIHLLVLLSACWTANALFAQLQPLPQTPLPQTPLSQAPLPQTPLPQTPLSQAPLPQTPQPQAQLSQTPLSQTPLSQTPQTPLPQTPLPQIPLPQMPLSPTAQNQSVQNQSTQNQLAQNQSTPNQPAQNQPVQNQSPDGTLSLTLTRTSPDNLLQALRQVCGHRFIAQSQYQYLFSSNWNNVPRQSLLRIEPQTNRILLTGDRQLSEQVLHLVAAIDLPPPQGSGRQLIPYQHVHPDVLVRALNSYRIQRPVTRRAPNTLSAEPIPAGQSNPSPVIQQVQYQEGGFLDAGNGFIEPGMFPQGTGMQGFLQSGDPAQIGVVDNSVFKYRLIPELDVIIIESEGPQLARFIEMIRELEELSKTNRPKIEVVYLKHVNNVSLGYIFTQDFYNLFFLTTQGQVRILAMTSPNAMLLIGWGDAMDVAKEVIEALDKPIAVENSRLHIFRLTHISANQALSVLQRTYSTPPANSGFLPRIQFVPDPRSNSLIVQAAPNDLEEVERVLKDIDVPKAGPTLQLKTIELKHSLAPDLEQTLTRAITGGSTDKFPSLELRIQSDEGQKLIQSGIMSEVFLSSDMRKNILIVKAPEGCMEFLEELVHLLDSSSPEAVIKIFQIEHGDASSLERMLRVLIPSNLDGTPGPQLPGSTEGEALIPIRFAVDARTNCIVAAGSSGDLMTVEALLNALDQEDSLTRELKVYPLKNMKAGPVADTINLYIETLLRLQAASPGVTSDHQQIESAIIVVADIESNSLIISATSKYYDEILKLIEDLDKSPPQVVINVLIAEVTLTENKEWAAELGLQDPLFLGRGGSMNFNNLGPGSLPSGQGTNPGTVASQMLTNFPGAVGRVGGGLVFSASSDYLNIMLRALHSNNRLEVLSSPTITTMNNVQAVLSVGQKVPRSKGGRTNQYGVIEYDLEDVPVNLMLTITPTISPEGTIVMGVVVVKDKVGGEIKVGDQTAQTIDTAELGTSISAANNQTVVLGGLITKETTADLKKVPLLGDIPVVGKMFRHETNKTVRKELLVILTPRIVTSLGDLDHVKQIEIARMNWCLKNVVETHGDIGAYSVVSPRPYTGNAPVITPGPVRMETLQPILAPTLPTPILPRRD